LLTVGVLALLAVARSVPLAAVELLLAGLAWIAVLTTANTAAQTLLPNWVRGRGLAVYLMAFYGAMTAGSLIWGGVADHGGLTLALSLAACVGVAALLFALWKPLPDAEPDLTPSLHWPEPAVQLEADHDQPVHVRIDYEIDPERRSEFLALLHEMAQERRRDGALRWELHEDTDRPGHFSEQFVEGSWAEHLRHHHRVTHAFMPFTLGPHRRGWCMVCKHERCHASSLLLHVGVAAAAPSAGVTSSLSMSEPCYATSVRHDCLSGSLTSASRIAPAVAVRTSRSLPQ
jgi:quinol monooxygenase YgiN